MTWNLCYTAPASGRLTAGCSRPDPTGQLFSMEVSFFFVMRLNSKKTWSQQELASKLRVGDPDKSSFLSWERRRLLIQAAKTALAAALCWWVASRFGWPDGYWGAISAIIVLQSNFGATITASRDRILGTVIGALLGFSFSLLGTVPWNYILAIFSAVAICGLLE